MRKWVFFVIFLDMATRLVNSLQIMPYLEEQGTISVPSSISLGTDDCLQIDLSSERMFRLGESGVIGSWFKNGSDYLEEANHEANPWEPTIGQFYLQQNYNQIIFGVKNRSQFWTIDSQDLSPVQSGNLTVAAGSIHSMAKAGNQIFTVSSTSNTSFQVNLASFTVSGSPISSNSSANINAGIGTRIKVDPTNTYIVVWNQKGAYFVRNVANMAVSVMDRFQFLTTSTVNNVDFSPDGSRMVIEFDNMANLTVIETTGFTTLATVSVPAIIKKVEFLNNTIIVLFHESYVSYYDSDTLSLVAQSSAPSTSEHIKADFLKHKVYECATGLIKIHKFRCPPLQYFKAGGFLECVPVTPVADCLAYNQQTGICSSCSTGLVVSAQGLCSHQENENGDCADHCLICRDSVCLKCSQGFHLEDHHCQGLPLYNVAELGVDGLQLIGPVVSYIMMFIQTVPLVSLFLQFVNYWNLACLYQLLDMNIPHFLESSNQLVFDSINVEYGELLNADLPKTQISSRQVEGLKLQAYQVDMDFYRYNIENIIYLLCLSAFAVLICAIRKRLDPSTYWYRILRINKLDVITGQAIGMTSLYFLPQRQVLERLSFQNFNEKLNACLQIFILICVFLLPVFFLWILIEKNKSIERAILAKQKISKEALKEPVAKETSKANKQLMVNRVESKQFWLYFINISIPVLVILPNSTLFFICNFLVLCQILRNSSKQTSYRLNSIILSLYFLCFHVLYTLMFISEDFWVDYYAGVSCLVLFLMGGIHELITFLVVTIYELVTWFKPFYRKLKDKDLNSRDQERKKSKKGTLNMHKSFNHIKDRESFHQRERKKCQKSMKDVTKEDYFNPRVKHLDSDLPQEPTLRKYESADAAQISGFQPTANYISSSSRVSDSSSLNFMKGVKRKLSGDSVIGHSQPSEIIPDLLNCVATKPAKFKLKNKYRKQKSPEKDKYLEVVEENKSKKKKQRKVEDVRVVHKQEKE